MMWSVLSRMNTMIKKISDFYFSSYREKLIENWGDFWYKNDHNSKTKKRENLEFDFCFDSAHPASFIYIRTFLRKKMLFKYLNIFEKKKISIFILRKFFLMFFFL